jgi:hypothetical protein
LTLDQCEYYCLQIGRGGISLRPNLPLFGDIIQHKVDALAFGTGDDGRSRIEFIHLIAPIKTQPDTRIQMTDRKFVPII